MPELSRFYGITIVMYYNDHGEPHFHAKYENQWAVFSAKDLKLTEGDLPRRVISLILEWAFEHRPELIEDWELVMNKKPIKKIDPLK